MELRTWHGYEVRILGEQFNVKPIEIKTFLAGTPHADCTRELFELMKVAGVPA